MGIFNINNILIAGLPRCVH